MLSLYKNQVKNVPVGRDEMHRHTLVGNSLVFFTNGLLKSLHRVLTIQRHDMVAQIKNEGMNNSCSL